MLASTCSSPLDDLGDSVIFIAIVHCFELTAIDRDHRSSEQAQLAAQHHKLGTHHPDRRALSLRKSAIVLKSGASRPVSHISSILRCASRSSRRLDLHAVEIAVEIDLQ